MKRILVTGGAGFIGSHLCERLLSLGNEVICLDNYFTGSKANIVHMIDNHYFELIRHDVTTPILVETDEIYNLACPASPVQYQYNGIKTIKTSVMGAINVLGLAKRTKSKVLQASTSEIYGDPEVHPQHEGYWGNVNTLGPRACYDEGKRCAETLFMNYHQQNNVRIKIARIFNTYGPNMNVNDGRVVSNFIVQALKGEDITIFGDGRQTRSFQYIDDLIDGLIKLMESPDSLIGPVNLGNPVEFTMRSLADMIIRMTSSKSKIIFLPLPQDDPKQRQPDISLAMKELDWSPTVDLETGLGKTIEYFREVLKG
jgi:UDP-glucuronate decarboxylase